MPAAAPRLLSTEPLLPADVVRPGTHGRILEAALGLFAQRGFHGTSIRDLGVEVGLKAANLYLHFESKEHLLAELVTLGHRAHHRRLRQALMLGATDVVEQLRAVVRAHVRAHAEFPMLATVANTEMHALSPELVAPALALRGESEALLSDLIERGLGEGVFHVPSAWLATSAIGAMGMRVAAWYRPEVDLDELADTYAEFAVRLLGTQTSTLYVAVPKATERSRSTKAKRIR